MDHSNTNSNNTNNNGLAGLVLILAGAALLASKLGYGIPHWIFSWQMLLIVIGLVSGIKKNFRGAGWLVMIIIGTVFLLEELLPESDLNDYLLPVGIICAGVVVFLRQKRGRTYHPENPQAGVFPGNELVKQSEYEIPGFTTATPGLEKQEPVFKSQRENGDFFRVSSIFSGVNRTIFSKDFKGGTISCIFGGCEIDLSNADITAPVTIKIEQMFGGTKLVIPRHWSVQNEMDGIFHSLEDERKHPGSLQYNPNKILIIKGSCAFAGVEIKSY